MVPYVKQGCFAAIFVAASAFAVKDPIILSQEFMEYHLQVAMEGVQDEDIFLCIQENIDNLDVAGTCNESANELINLIEEGYTIDPFNMARLIKLMEHANPSDQATRVIIRAIEFRSPITSDHLMSLIKMLSWANASDNATKVLLTAIKHGVPFGPKERLALARASKVANARSNVEKIRRAIHEQAYG